MAFNPFSFLTRTRADDNEVKQLTSGHVESPKATYNRNYNPHIISQLIDAESVLNKRLANLQTVSGVYDTAELDLTLAGAADSATNKDLRRRSNWQLAFAPEIAWCIDEIMSELMDFEILLKYDTSYHLLTDKKKQIIETEYDRFIKLFNFDSEQFQDDIRNFIIEGELAYEAIVAEDKPEFGVIGIRRLATEAYTVVHTPIVNNGFVLNINVDSLFNKTGIDHFSGRTRTQTAQSRLVFNRETNTYETDKTHVALTFPNVIYTCYDKDNVTNQPISLLDKAREPYLQLAALQQAALVMRITRSPERLLFNIDTGGMADKVAREHIRKFGNALSKKKTVTPDGDITQTYNPSTMLESWIFGKSNANSGTTVSSVTSTANFEQMADIEYFHNRLLNIFKIPFSRITAAEKQYISGDSLTYDECRFYKFVQAIQIKLNNIITKLFLHNLKLRGLEDAEGADIYIEIQPPVRYRTYLNNQILRDKFDVYSMFADRDEFNKEILMQDHLDMSNDDIRAHRNRNLKMEDEPAQVQSASGYQGAGDGGGGGGGNFGGDFGGDDFDDFDDDFDMGDDTAGDDADFDMGDDLPSPDDSADDSADDSDDAEDDDK